MCIWWNDEEEDSADAITGRQRGPQQFEAVDKRFVEVTTRAVWTDGAVYASVVGSYLRGDRGGVTKCALTDTCLRMTEAALQREPGCALTTASRFD